MIFYPYVFSFLIIVSQLFSIQTKSVVKDINLSDWRTNVSSSVVKKRYDKTVIARFVSKTADIEPMLNSEQIGDFKWVDVDNDGVYELLVTVTVGRFFNDMYIFKNIHNNKILTQTINVWDLKSFDSVVQDLNSDGVQELLLPVCLTEYRGARPIAIWTSVYKWNGKELIDSSQDFPKFYLESLLSKIDEELKQLQLTKLIVRKEAFSEEINFNQEIYDEDVSTQYLIKDKILRITKQDLHAGFQRALEWSKHPNPNLRANAVFVFNDIGDKESKENIELLKHDPNPVVSMIAGTVEDLKPAKNNIVK